MNLHFATSTIYNALDFLVRQCGCALLCCAVMGLYLAVQLLVQLTDALCQLGQLFSDDSMVNSLSSVRLHVKVLSQEICVALCTHNSTSTLITVHIPILFINIRLLVHCNKNKTRNFLFQLCEAFSLPLFSASFGVNELNQTSLCLHIPC